MDFNEGIPLTKEKENWVLISPDNEYTVEQLKW